MQKQRCRSDQLCSNVQQLISAFVFATWIVKFLSLYRTVFVGLVRNPDDHFSRIVAQKHVLLGLLLYVPVNRYGHVRVLPSFDGNSIILPNFGEVTL